MKKAVKNEIDLLGLITKIQDQLNALDKKIDSLISRSIPETKPAPKPIVNNPNLTVRPNDRNNGRTMHTAICADCKKECTIPFKPSGDRPVYCKDCFSRRKMVSLSKIGMEDKPPVIVQEPPVKSKKKAVAVKKPIAKKKSAPKKK